MEKVEKAKVSYYRDSDKVEKWYEYDAAGNEVHFRDSDGLEEWREYDGYYRAIGREVPEVPVTALSPERKNAFDKCAYYSRKAKKEFVDFVKSRYEEKAAYWKKVFRREAVTPEEEARCGPGHKWDAVDSFIHAKYCFEKAVSPDEKERYRILGEYFEAEARKPSSGEPEPELEQDVQEY